MSEDIWARSWNDDSSRFEHKQFLAALPTSASNFLVVSVASFAADKAESKEPDEARDDMNADAAPDPRMQKVE
jgi:hypothetical protein